jgi:F-type H+-transporting ATPase subunit b
MASVTSQLVPMESNFLVPNATFLVELAVFALLFFLLAKYVVPPINRAMTARQDAIRNQFADLDQAKQDANEAEEKFKAQLADARHEAAKIREDAREQGAQIIAEMRELAQSEARRLTEQAHQQIEADRVQAVNSLRTQVGTLATDLAGRIVGESLEDDARQRRVVDRFLDELEARADEGSTAPDVGQTATVGEDPAK